MIQSNEKLRKNSDSIFQETEVPESRSRPLEWRRSFNNLSLPLRNLQIVRTIATHDHFDWEELTPEEHPATRIKPTLSTRIGVSAFVNEKLMRDSVYFAEKNSSDEEIYTFLKPGGATRVILQAGKPTQGHDVVPDGVFLGKCYEDNNGFFKNGVCFTLSIPEDQLNILTSTLQSDPTSNIRLSVELLSYSYEVDDSLRDFYDPRDLIVDRPAYAFIHNIELLTKIGHHTLSSKPDYDTHDYDETMMHQELEPQQTAHIELLQTLSNLQKPMKNIAVAIWVLIAVTGAAIFF